MDEKTTAKWMKMHKFHTVLNRIATNPINKKLTREVIRKMAIAEYEKQYGERYRRPGVHFNW